MEKQAGKNIFKGKLTLSEVGKDSGNEESPEKLPAAAAVKIKPYSHYVLLWNHKSVDSPKIKAILTRIAEHGIEDDTDFVKSILSMKELCNTRCYSKAEKLYAFRLYAGTIPAEERTKLFKVTIPFIATLALRVELLHPDGTLPLLSAGKQNLVKQSRSEVSCALANAFFCCVPSQSKELRLGEYDMYTLMCDESVGFKETVKEKFKCIFCYFEAIREKEPEGIITIARNCLSEEEKKQYSMEGWLNSEKPMQEMQLDVQGRIESQHEMLQVDFANKYIGGGIDGFCYQEQVLFAISPELYASCLVCERMEEDEAIVVTGVQVFSEYKGYDMTFRFAGPAKDPLESKRDRLERIPRQILGLDALCFPGGPRKLEQFQAKHTVRELNKALVGFKGDFLCDESDKRPIATGKWGCGVFNGCLEYKWLIQWLAASEVGRKMVFCGFDDTSLTSFYSFIKKLEGRKVGEVAKILLEISELVLSKWEKDADQEEPIKLNELITQVLKKNIP